MADEAERCRESVTTRQLGGLRVADHLLGMQTDVAPLTAGPGSSGETPSLNADFLRKITARK
jgi:hypothetical protein